VKHNQFNTYSIYTYIQLIDIVLNKIHSAVYLNVDHLLPWDIHCVVVSCLDKGLPQVFSNTVYYKEHLNSTENPTSKKKTIQTVDWCGLQTSHLWHHHTQLGWADCHGTNTLQNVNVKQGETLTT